MSRLEVGQPKGVLRRGWSNTVDDYAIAGGWAQRGKVLIVADAAGGVHAFDATSGERHWAHREIHKGGVLAVSVHPDGTALATAGQDGRVRVWDVLEGQVQQAIDVANNWVEHVAWSADGRWLAATCSRQVRVWGEDGVEVWHSDDHPSTVSAIAWSGPEELATACYGRVTFFGIPRGLVRQQLEWQGSLVSMALSPSGDIVACGSQDNSVHFWRRTTGADSMMSGYPGKPSALAFNDSGQLLATGGGEAVTVWSFQGDGPEGTIPGVLQLHAQPVTTLAFAPQGMRLASGARDGTVAVWSLQSDGNGRRTGRALVDDIIDGLHWRPDGRALAAFDARGGITAWRVSNG